MATVSPPDALGVVNETATPTSGEPKRPLEEKMTTEAFRHAFRRHPAGVAIVTADASDGPVAMTLTSTSSVSASPPHVMFSLSASSSASPAVSNAETVVLHLLSSDELELAKLGAASGIDRFADRASWDRLPTGEPFFPTATNWMRCRTVARLTLEGSIVMVALALESHTVANAVGPLVYHDRSWHRLTSGSTIADR